jgi:hypothetical protein
MFFPADTRQEIRRALEQLATALHCRRLPHPAVARPNYRPPADPPEPYELQGRQQLEELLEQNQI